MFGGGMSGMNVTNINQPQRQNNQQPTQQPIVNQPQNTTNQQQPQQQQMPNLNMGNLANMASMLFPQPQQGQHLQSQSQSQVPPNPLGGIMGMFSSMQQSGGIG
jgi:hypothetical protein